MEQQLYQRLSSDSQLQSLLGSGAVWNGQPPRDAALPLVVFSLASGGDMAETPRRQVDLTYLVKAVAERLDQAHAIAQRVDELLHDFDPAPAGWRCFWCRRDSVLELAEMDPAGHAVWHVGGHYVLRIAQE